MNTELVKYIQQKILPQYANYDAAHNLLHISTVIDQSMQMSQHYNVDVDMVYTIAAYHDLGQCKGRELHHIYSAQMLLSDTELLRWFTLQQMQTMAEAIEDHRASSKNAPRSVYGVIVAEADRFIESETIIRRTIQYGLANYPQLNKTGHYERMLHHLHEKYAEGGYLKLLSPYSPNAVRLQQLRQIIANEQQLQILFDKIWDEETK
ncbi:MAG: HD domain-containing protein [Salinivirgaceae bacterium]|nr:HD domain-containing protein [Salinivirgaceae bacterium]